MHTIDEDTILNLPGVGKSLREKIKEIFKQGFLPQTQDMMKDAGKMDAIEAMTKIMSIGPVKARELVEEHGIMTIEQLRATGMHLLNEKQILGVKYHEDFMMRIPRPEMERHLKHITDAVAKINPRAKVEMTDSFRRGLMTSGDIDILLTLDAGQNDMQEAFQKLVKELKSTGYLKDDFAYGDKKYMGVSKLPRFKHFRRIDIMATPPEQFPFAVLYFTGSQKFNIAMRNHALSLGYSLNEYGLKYLEGENKGELVKSPSFKSENDIFAFLKLAYVSPEDREAGKITILAA